MVLTEREKSSDFLPLAIAMADIDAGCRYRFFRESTRDGSKLLSHITMI